MPYPDPLSARPLHKAIQTQGSQGHLSRPSMQCRRGENALKRSAGSLGGEVVAKAWKPSISLVRYQ